MSRISQKMAENAALTEAALKKYLEKQDDKFPVLFEAMRYGVLNGGKRIRPFLTIEFCRLFGGDVQAAMPFACGLEMIHACSLIYDDMPCMDNDDLRRGVPTTHKAYGEACALLAGDALHTYAFGIMAENSLVSPENRLKAISATSDAVGGFGMIGGQQLDLWGEDNEMDFDTLKYLHSLKTGCLIRAACVLGCLAAGRGDDEALKIARDYAEGVGMTFQIIDDILDEIGDEALLGKPVGSDDENHKTTFLTFMDIDRAREYAGLYTNQACDAIAALDGNETLTELADMLLHRNK